MKVVSVFNCSEFILVDDEDQERISMFTWCRSGRNSHKDYFRLVRKVSIGSSQIDIPIANEVMNRPKILFDHIDRDQFNNQKHNLREATISQNLCNKDKTLYETTSKYKGVCRAKNVHKWSAEISFNKQRVRLGHFLTQEDAARAYNKAAIGLHKEFAVLNRDENGNILC